MKKTPDNSNSKYEKILICLQEGNVGICPCELSEVCREYCEKVRKQSNNKEGEKKNE